MTKTTVSELQKFRARFRPVLPRVFAAGPKGILPRLGKAVRVPSEIGENFPATSGVPIVTFARGKNPALAKKRVRVGVVLSGGQAPGGHNVIAGILDALQAASPQNKLFGFLGGPSGILENRFIELTPARVLPFRNTGGFDMIQSGRTKIETAEQFARAKQTLVENRIDALVVIGGDDSNTNAALLAEYLKTEGTAISVVGVPKTIDGDLKNEYIEASFGFDTASKTYSELVGNICRDVRSSQKYWHMIRLMGRSASHITLEVAFKTHPNVTLIGEEILAKEMTLADVVEQLVLTVIARSREGKNYGVALVPEGIVEFIPEFRELIGALNDLLSAREADLAKLPSFEAQRDLVVAALADAPSRLMSSLPPGIQAQLMQDRDPHGNVVVSLIETEKLLLEMMKVRLAEKRKAGEFAGKFGAITHFFGYEGRCGAPSNFDANYCFALGYSAALLALSGLTGYLASVRGLTKPAASWTSGGVPLTTMMNIERRHGVAKPVIKKALVALEGGAFRAFAKERDHWAQHDAYEFPGPVQYFGPAEITEQTTRTLRYEQKRK